MQCLWMPPVTVFCNFKKDVKNVLQSKEITLKENKNFFSLFDIYKFLQLQSWNLIVWPPSLENPHSYGSQSLITTTT